MRERFSIALLAAAGLGACLGLAGCRGQRQDTVLSWALNPSHTWRATVVQREYFIDGHRDAAPTTYVLLDAGSGAPEYENGQEFTEAEVVMKPSRCGPLRLTWTGDESLEVRCEKCGLALSAAGRHASGVGKIRVEYAGFPERSSWEAGGETR
jgi:hypothetical protein